MADGGLNICGFGSVLGRGAGFGQNLPEGAALLDVGGDGCPHPNHTNRNNA